MIRVHQLIRVEAGTFLLHLQLLAYTGKGKSASLLKLIWIMQGGGGAWSL